MDNHIPAYVSHRLMREGNVFRCAACGRERPVEASPYDFMVEPISVSYPCTAIPDSYRQEAIAAFNKEFFL